MVKCEAARPAIQKGKPVLDAAREYFWKDYYICRYINTIYRELHKKDGKKKHWRKGAAQGQERDTKATSSYEYGLSGLFNETRAAQGQEYDLSGLFNETRAAQGQERDNKGDVDLC